MLRIFSRRFSIAFFVKATTSTLNPALPAAFAERYGEIKVGRIRGGIRVAGQTLQAPLEPE